MASNTELSGSSTKKPRLEVSSSSTKLLLSSESLLSTSKLHPQPHEIAERSIAMFFLENKIEFSAARSPSFHQMIDSIAKLNGGISLPSPEALKTTWLERIKSEVKLQFKEVSEKEWGATGCTIIVDSWTDNKSKALIKFFISSPSRTFFHKMVDASSYFKNTKCLADLFDSVIQEIGAENVVQIVMENTLNYTGIANHILQNYGTIFVSPCASQCLNSILEDFSKVDWVDRCILQAQVITKFVYNNATLIKKFPTENPLLKTGISKSVTTFLTLQAILKQKSKLRQEIGSNPNFQKGILEDGEFWKAVEESVAISEPFLKVLREVSGLKPTIGSIYEMMTRAKDSIRTYYIMDENKCKTFLDIVERKWRDSLHSPLHSAAAFLHPSIQYNSETKFLISIKQEFYTVIEKLLPTPDLRRDITNQIFLFTRANGMFGCGLAMEARDSVPPGVWWEQFGDAAPVLQRVAMRVLSQGCSTHTCGKDWGHTCERRNKVEKEVASDVMYVNYNVRLGRGRGADVDAIVADDVEMGSEWVEESENVSTSQWLDRFGSALDGDLNTRFSAVMFGANDPIFGL